MLRLDYQTYRLAFEYPFQISKGIKTHQEGLVIFLAMGAQYGLGEATQISYYPESQLEHMTEMLQRYLPQISRYAFNGPERFWHYLHHLLPSQNFLISALDIASWDLWARLQGKPVYQMMGFHWENIPSTDYTLGVADEEQLKQKIREKPFPVYKIKVDGINDAKIIQTVLQHSKAKIRIDANEAWTKEHIVELKSFWNNPRIELIEQPFHRDDEESMRLLKEVCSIPIIADEAIKDMQDLRMKLHLFDGVNIKLSKCGGLTPAREMISVLKKENKKIMLGSMSESRIGAAALAQLLPVADYADIDGPLLMKEHVAQGIDYSEVGQISFDEHQGIGVRW